MTKSPLRQTQLAMQRFWLGFEAPNKKIFQSPSALQGLELYGRLMRYGWHDVMLSIYPYCAQILSDRWELVVDNYLKHYPPCHYNLNRLSEKFTVYLGLHEEGLRTRFPFIAQLADYEWLELEIMEHPAVIGNSVPPTELLVEHFESLAPIVNPTLTLRRYEFPVSKIAGAIEATGEYESILSENSETIIAFRQPGGTGCRLRLIDDFAAAVLESAKSGNLTFKDLALVAVNTYPELHPHTAVVKFIDLVEKFEADGVFVGTK